MNADADALYDAIHTRIFREEFREIYARMAAAGRLDPQEVREAAQRNWPDGAEGWQAETYAMAVRAAFERGAAWQSRRGGGHDDAPDQEKAEGGS